MSTQAPEREVEVVTGQVTHILVKGEGKWQIAVQPQGSQYTKNLWTKDYGLVQQMEANINSWYSFVCGVSPWTNAQGQPVRSLWVNEVTAPGQVVQAEVTQAQRQAQQPQPLTPTAGVTATVTQNTSSSVPQGQPGISPLEKEERIMREHAMGVVALMLPHLPPEERNATGMIAVAEGLIAYYRLGPPASNGRGQDANQDAVEAAADEYPPDPDDDIPF